MGARVSLLLIRCYQHTLSGHLGRCRYEPSCSRYAYEAIQRYGARRGWRLARERLARCRPYAGCPSGWDPVPEEVAR